MPLIVKAIANITTKYFAGTRSASTSPKPRNRKTVPKLAYFFLLPILTPPLYACYHYIHKHNKALTGTFVSFNYKNRARVYGDFSNIVNNLITDAYAVKG